MGHINKSFRDILIRAMNQKQKKNRRTEALSCVELWEWLTAIILAFRKLQYFGFDILLESGKSSCFKKFLFCSVKMIVSLLGNHS